MEAVQLTVLKELDVVLVVAVLATADGTRLLTASAGGDKDRKQSVFAITGEPKK